MVTKVFSDKEGLVKFNNIDIDKLNGAYIKETKAPEGYRLNNNKIQLNKDTIKENLIELGNIKNYKLNTTLPDTGISSMLYQSIIIIFLTLVLNKYKNK